MKTFTNQNNIKNYKSVFESFKSNFLRLFVFIALLYTMALISSCASPRMVPYSAGSYRHYEFDIRKGFGTYASGGGTHHEFGGPAKHLGGHTNDASVHYNNLR